MNKKYLKLSLNKRFLQKKSCSFFSTNHASKNSTSSSNTDFNNLHQVQDALRKKNQDFKVFAKTKLQGVLCKKQKFQTLPEGSSACFSQALGGKQIQAKLKNKVFMVEKFAHRPTITFDGPDKRQGKETLMHQNWIQYRSHIGHKPLRLANKNKREFYPVASKYLLGKRHKLNYMHIQHSLKQTLSSIHVIASILQKGGCFLIVNSNQIFDKVISTGSTPFSHLANIDMNPVNTVFREAAAKNSKKQNKVATTFPSKGGEKQPEPSLGKELFLKKSGVSRSCGFKNGISFTQYKWIGGSLSNWNQMCKTVWRVAKFSEEFEKFLKMHNISFPRYKELKKCFRGLVEKQDTSTRLCFQKKPDLIFIANCAENLSIVREANSLRIPVMALTDSNTNLLGISYPIPVNTESIYFFFGFLDLVTKIHKKM